MYSPGRSRPVLRVHRLEKRQNKSEKDEENISSNEKEEEECHVTTTSTRAADTFDFFQQRLGFSIVLPHQYLHGEHHDPLLLHVEKLPLGTTHPTHVPLGAVCPFHHWVGYFPLSLMLHHLISHCPHLMIFILLSKIVHAVILA